MVDLRLTEGASYHATDAEVKKLENWLQTWNKQHQGIDNFVAYIGVGSPRYYLPLDIQLAHRGFAQFVILSKDLDAARELCVVIYSNYLKMISPACALQFCGWKMARQWAFRCNFAWMVLIFRKFAKFAHQIADIMRANPNLTNVQLGWEEPSKVMKVVYRSSKSAPARCKFGGYCQHSQWRDERAYILPSLEKVLSVLIWWCVAKKLSALNYRVCPI